MTSTTTGAPPNSGPVPRCDKAASAAKRRDEKTRLAQAASGTATRGHRSARRRPRSQSARLGRFRPWRGRSIPPRTPARCNISRPRATVGSKRMRSGPKPACRRRDSANGFVFRRLARQARGSCLPAWMRATAPGVKSPLSSFHLHLQQSRSNLSTARSAPRGAA